jgi:hypothetical protein
MAAAANYLGPQGRAPGGATAASAAAAMEAADSDARGPERNPNPTGREKLATAAAWVEAVAMAAAARRSASHSATSQGTVPFQAAPHGPHLAGTSQGAGAPPGSDWPGTGDPPGRQQRAVQALRDALAATRDARHAAAARIAADAAARRNGPPI